MGGHQNDPLPNVGGVLPVVRTSVGRKLQEVIPQPLPFLHLVGLLKIDDRGLAVIDPHQIRGPRIPVHEVNLDLVAPDLVKFHVELVQ